MGFLPCGIFHSTSIPPNKLRKISEVFIGLRECMLATVKQHPLAHHPLDTCYYSVMDEPQLAQYWVSPC